MKRIAIIAAVLLFAGGCDSLQPSELDQEIVVESYLVAGQTLSDVRLTRTIPIDEIYDAAELGVRDADVRIELLDNQGRVEETYVLRHRPTEPGVYRADDAPDVKPLRTYRMVATAPEADGPITATTTVPDTLRVVAASGDTVVYRSQEQFIFYVSPTLYPGRQNVFILSTRAFEPLESRLTPFAESIYENGDATLADLSESVSPLLNEENFEREDDGSLRIRYPWLGLNFYGRNRVTLESIDNNLYDFIRSQSVQQGGSTLPPGEIPNVLENVDGGRGIFGSVARASVEFEVLRSPDDGN